MIIDLFSGWWILAIIFGVLYGAAAIAGLFLVLVVGDVQAREDETYRASGWPNRRHEWNRVREICRGRDAGFEYQTAVQGPTPNGP